MSKIFIKESRKKYVESYIKFEYAITCCYFVMKLDKAIMRPIIKNGLEIKKIEKVGQLSGVENSRRGIVALVQNIVDSIISDIDIDGNKMHKMSTYLGRAFYQEEWGDTRTFSSYLPNRTLENHRRIRNILFHKLILNEAEEKALISLVEKSFPIENTNNMLIILCQVKINQFLSLIPEMREAFIKNKYLSWIMMDDDKRNNFG